MLPLSGKQTPVAVNGITAVVRTALCGPQMFSNSFLCALGKDICMGPPQSVVAVAFSNCMHRCNMHLLLVFLLALDI